MRMLSLSPPASFEEEVDHGYLFHTQDGLANSFHDIQSVTVFEPSGSLRRQIDLLSIASQPTVGVDSQHTSRPSSFDQNLWCSRQDVHRQAGLHDTELHEASGIVVGNTESILGGTKVISRFGYHFVSSFLYSNLQYAANPILGNCVPPSASPTTCYESAEFNQPRNPVEVR